MGRLFSTPLKQALTRAAKPITKKRGFSETRILSDWPLIVGEHLADCAIPLKLSFPRDKQTDATLTLSVHPAYALELQQMTPLILDKIASYVGFRAVARILIEQTYHALPEHEKHTHSLQPTTPPPASNDPLDAALERLKQLRASKE